MAWYPFPPTAALNTEGELAQSGSGAIYALDDTGFTTPLTVRDASGASITSVTVSSIGVHQWFEVEDHGAVWWKSGSLPAVHLVSYKGYLDATVAAQDAAEVAATAAQDIADLVIPPVDTQIASFIETPETATQTAVLSLADDAATPSRLTWRNASGQSSFGAPTDPSHAATKGYVDGLTSGTVRGEDGRPLRIVAGVLRNTGSGWGLISDSGHEAVNVDSVSDSTTAITVDYSSIGATKVVSFVVAPDETFARQGFTTGASVGLTSSSIQIMQSRPFSDYVSWNGSAWVSLGGVFTLSYSAGILACGHPKIPAGVNVNHVQVTGRGVLPVHLVSGNSETNVSIAWYNWSGTLQTTPSTDMRAFIAKGASGPLDPQQINTTLYPSSNLWFMGVFEVAD